MEELRTRTIERLNGLANPIKQIAFAYSACQRMLPNYQYFSRNYGWGNEYCMIEALDIIRNFLLLDLKEFEKSKLLSTIYNSIPNSGDFSTSFSTYAQNSASAIYYTLNSIFKVDVQELSWVLVLSRDTVDAFVQEIEDFKFDEKFEKKISNHCMMQRELQKQQLDFSLLMNQSEINEQVLKSNQLQ